MAVARHRYTPRGKDYVQSKHISYTGMRDSKDPSTSHPRKASYLLNVYPVQSLLGGGLEGRPGYTDMGSSVTGRTQVIAQYTQLDGDEFTIRIVGGKFYTYDWGADSWTETLTAAHFSSASITLSTTAVFSWVVFNNQIVFSDGVNTPWMWDGTSGGGLTSLTNAPVAYGPPTVYYSKLFFIEDANRSTIAWSEENQPNTGYGSSNQWTLGQTDQDQLFRLFGTNSGLYYWRKDSIGVITGRVTPDFQTTGTHDDISLTIGTRSPWSVVYHKKTFYFVDSDGHPQMFRIGESVADDPPIWYDAAETTKGLSPAKFVQIRGIYRPREKVILFLFTPQSADENDQALVYSADSGEFVGVWSFNTSLVEAAVVKDGSGDNTFVHGTEDGEAYFHGDPDGTVWSDDGVKITHSVWASPMLWDPRDEKFFSRVDISFRLDSALSNVGFTTVAPDCGGMALNPGTLTGDSTALWGVAVWGVSLWSAESVEAHIAIGVECRGRWIQPRLSHDTLDERFAFLGWSVLAQHVGRDPYIS